MESFYFQLASDICTNLDSHASHSLGIRTLHFRNDCTKKADHILRRTSNFAWAKISLFGIFVKFFSGKKSFLIAREQKQIHVYIIVLVVVDVTGYIVARTLPLTKNSDFLKHRGIFLRNWEVGLSECEKSLVAMGGGGSYYVIHDILW